MSATKIDTKELIALWAWSEMRSSRFGPSLRQQATDALVERAEAGAAFEDLSDGEKAALAEAQRQSRPKAFVDALLSHGGAQFELVEWSPEQLLSARVLPMLGDCSFVEFLARPPRMREPGKLNPIDPRVAAMTVPFDPQAGQEGPVIALQRGQQMLLFEGYLRAILWLRRPATPLPVWVPTGS